MEVQNIMKVQIENYNWLTNEWETSSPIEIELENPKEALDYRDEEFFSKLFVQDIVEEELI